MSKNYENLKGLDQRVVESFKTKTYNEFTVWVRQQLRPLETAGVLCDALNALVQNNSTVKSKKEAKTKKEKLVD